MKKRFYLPMVSSLLLALGSASAQTAETSSGSSNIEDMNLESMLGIDIQVASGRGGDGVLNSPSTVSVIDRTMIERYNFQTVGEAVQTIAGFGTMRTYLKRNLPISRGILGDHYANKVLVMINGTPLFNAVTGEGSLDRVGIDSVERIEVLKGPASVVYGSNAYTGAVNVVTRHTNSGGHGRITAGQYSRFSGSTHVTQTNADESIFIAGQGTNDAGFDANFIDEAGRLNHYNEFIEDNSATGRYAVGSHSLTLNGFAVNESYLGITPAATAGIGESHKIKGYMANYTFDKVLLEGWSMKASVVYDQQERRAPRGWGTVAGNWPQLRVSDIAGNRMFGTVRSTYQIVPELGITAGVDVDRRYSDSYNELNLQTYVNANDNNMNGKSLTEQSIFAQLDYRLAKVRLVGGGRYTSNEVISNNISTSASAVWEIDTKSSLKFIFGQSFRTPSLFELYFLPTAATNRGNINLKPETAQTFELAYLTSFDNIFVQALVYQAAYKDVITRAPNTLGGAPVTMNVNAGEINARGFELETRFEWTDFQTFLNIGYVDSFDNVGGVNSAATFVKGASVNGTLGASLNLGKFTVSAIGKYLGKQYGPLREIEGQWTGDVNVRHRQKLANFNLSQYLSYKNFGDTPIFYPEIARGNLNEVPGGFGPTVMYTARADF